MKQATNSSHGLSLVELLATLALIGIISTAVIGYLLNGMNNFEKVNREINLHDEANSIMRQFENVIFVSKNVIDVEQSSEVSLVKATNMYEEETVLGFKNNQAVINDVVIHSPRFTFLDDSTITLSNRETKKEGKVLIRMVIKDHESKEKSKIELENEISYIKVNN